jgi:hypothetical protein
MMAFGPVDTRAHNPLHYALIVSIAMWITVTTMSHMQFGSHELKCPLELEEFKKSFSSPRMLHSLVVVGGGGGKENQHDLFCGRSTIDYRGFQASRISSHYCKNNTPSKREDQLYSMPCLLQTSSDVFLPTRESM